MMGKILISMKADSDGFSLFYFAIMTKKFA